MSSSKNDTKNPVLGTDKWPGIRRGSLPSKMKFYNKSFGDFLQTQHVSSFYDLLIFSELPIHVQFILKLGYTRSLDLESVCLKNDKCHKKGER